MHYVKVIDMSHQNVYLFILRRVVVDNEIGIPSIPLAKP